jgi:hypothetical protein
MKKRKQRKKKQRKRMTEEVQDAQNASCARSHFDVLKFGFLRRHSPSTITPADLYNQRSLPRKLEREQGKNKGATTYEEE